MSDTIRAHQEPLFVESLEEAIEATARACGGKKQFACALRPDLEDEPDKAHRWLLDALNSDRRTEFHVDHLRRACTIARKHGCHILKHWFDDATGYERTGVAPSKTPRQELAEKMQRALDDFRRLADEDAAIRKAEAGEYLRTVR